MASRDLSDLILDFRARVQDLLQTCRARGVEMRPYTTLRDPFEQARLWRQSRSREEIDRKIDQLRNVGADFLAHCLDSVGPQNGRYVTDAAPGLSWHQWGEALDCFWLVEGQAEWSTERRVNGVNGYRVYAEEAKRLGLTAGGDWINFQDWSHVQLRAASGPQEVLSLLQIDRAMREGFGEVARPPAQPSSAAPPTAAVTTAMVSACDDFAELHDGPYVLQNNIWNRSSATAAKQCIEHKGSARFQWTWNWPDLNDGQVRSYPSLLFGHKPWRSASTTPRLPAPIGSIEQLSAQYEIAVTGSGIFNAAFDLWLSADAIPSEASITTEIMVWVHNQEAIPAGSPVATAPTSLGDLTMYRGRISTWSYLALVCAAPIPKGTLDLAELLALLVYNGYVSASHYLSSVELGTEIWHGAGKAAIKRFAIV